MSPSELHTDIIIIGGGIAGLWLLDILKQRGYSCLLIEKTALGHGQTIASQGIIHSGIKYSLSQHVTQATHAIKNMPSEWDTCLRGNGSVNLSETRVLSPYHYLWSPSQLCGGVQTFLAQKLLANSQVIHKEDYPEVLQQDKIRGSVCRVNEYVLDVPSLLSNFKNQHAKSLVHGQAELIMSPQNDIQGLHLTTANNITQRISASQYIFTAGAGTDQLIPTPMQRRPLHQSIIYWPYELEKFRTYLHILGSSNKPLMTISTHPHKDGCIWYIGGLLAEEGVKLSQSQHLEKTHRSLKKHFPHLPWHQATFDSFRIDRAEALCPHNQRPTSPTILSNHNYHICWPTKLTFAPALAHELCSTIQSKQAPSHHTVEKPDFWPTPSVSTPPWQLKHKESTCTTAS